MGALSNAPNSVYCGGSFVKTCQNQTTKKVGDRLHFWKDFINMTALSRSPHASSSVMQTSPRPNQFFVTVPPSLPPSFRSSLFSSLHPSSVPSRIPYLHPPLLSSLLPALPPAHPTSLRVPISPSLPLIRQQTSIITHLIT